ncbi:MAG: hypothetical protein L0Y66_06510, partial [Myxococcaceae bacterium]|nr:hypothetical protein [Myxococcaceae bacterium]
PVQLPGPKLQSIAVDRNLLLVGETDGDLQQVATSRLALLGGAVDTGPSPNDILVDPPYVYVVESLQTNSLLVFRREEGGSGGAAVFTLVDQLPLGARTSPQAMAKVGHTLFIPLYGGMGSDDAARAGQKVVRVDVSDPGNLRLEGDISLMGMDLRTFPAETSYPYPYGITVFNGSLYLPLTNLNPTTLKPGGPALLAKVDPASGAVTSVPLDDASCLNAVHAQPVAGHLAVSCQGRVLYSSEDWTVTGVERSAIVLLDAEDHVVDTYPFTCAGGGAACAFPVASRFAVVGSSLYVGDQSRGRVVVLEVQEGRLVEKRGFGGEGGGPLQVCPASSNGGNSVTDIAVVP